MTDIYKYSDYKGFLIDALKALPKGGRSALAKAANCQSGYITHVLNGHSHFSLEQGEAIATLLGLDETQTQFFLDLINMNRAGAESLRRHYAKRLRVEKERNSTLKSKLKTSNTLSVEDQAIFYSSWHYGAIHVCVSAPGCETEIGISKHFNLPLSKVNQIVQFLLRIGLIERKGEKLVIGKKQIFISSDSPLISKFHTNWRVKSIASLDQYTERDLHYSSVITCSKSDVEKIREIMVRTIEEIRSVVRDSPDEDVFAYAFDLFKV